MFSNNTRRDFLRNLAGIVTATLFIPGNRANAFAFLASDTDEYIAIDRGVETYMTTRRLPGMAIAVMLNGNFVYSKGFGKAIVETGSLFRPTTRCRIGSISKGLTAIGIAVLLEMGLVSLDDPVVPMIDKLLAEKAERVDPRWNQITIRHCLAFKTGLTDDTAGEQERIAKELSIAFPPRGKAILEWRSKRPLQLDPGAKYVYNGYGHYLLARVIEAKSGLTYQAFMKKMSSTRFVFPVLNFLKDN